MKRKGVCYVCGCTDAEGCDGGCGWANLKQTLCSACEPLDDRERQDKRAEALSELRMRRDVAKDELAGLQERIDVLTGAVPLVPTREVLARRKGARR